MPKPLRIFISSPGDVSAERRRAALVVESLKKEFARFFDISAYLWEHEAMLATGHFQDVIEPPSQSDIVVLILWSRLGTPLPEKSGEREYKGIDGRAPVTGTEWEYEDALAANRSKGAPDLLVYRSNREPQISLRDPQKKALAENQWSALETFWSRYFQAGGVFLSAFHGFDDLEDFGDMLEAHLRQLIRARIEKGRIEAGAETKATWLQSPFRGLSSYDFEHAPIFFGRGAAQLKAVEQIVLNANAGKAFLLVLGASGSGKSSLVRAGLLPNLFARGVADGAGLWRRATFKPGDAADGNLFRGLARALTEDRVKDGIGLPELLGPGVTLDQLENALRRSIDDPSFVFAPAIGRVTEKARAEGRIMAHESARLTLVLDQLEEVFTEASITTEERNTFIRLIGSLAKSGMVWIVATMRSDFWHKAAATPELVALAEATGRMDLLPPSQAELTEMIRRPAAAAGLSFEDHATTRIALDGVIAEEAARDPGSLPLVSFVLDALYRTDVEKGRGSVLTYDTYEALGGIKGAIAKRADEILNAQTPDVQAAFPAVLRALVTVESDRDQNATARMTPLSAFPAGSPRRRLVDAFLDPQARLLIADGDGGEARVRVAHEALINHWARAREQINRDRRDLETRARLEEDEALWRAAPPAEKSARLLEGLALEEGKDLVGKWDDELPQSLKDYIAESAKAATSKRRRSMRILTAVAAVMAVLAVGSGIASLYAVNYAAEADRKTIEANDARAATDAQLLETKRGQARLIERQSYAASQQGLPELALALAVESVRVGEETGSLPRASLAALQHAGSTDTIVSVLANLDDTIGDADFGYDTSTIFTGGGNDGRLVLWDTFSGRERTAFGTREAPFVTGISDLKGNYLVITYRDQTAQFLNYDELTQVGELMQLKAVPSALDIDAEGRAVAIGDEQGNVRIVSPATQEIYLDAKGHDAPVVSVELADNLTIAVSADATGKAVIWDLSSLTQRAVVTHGNADTPSAIKNVVVSARGDQFALVGNGWASIFNAAGELIHTFDIAGTYLFDIVYSSDGETLLYSAGSTVTAVSKTDFSVRQVFTGHTFEIRGMEITTDGKRLLTASADNTLRVWDVSSGATLRVFRSPRGGSISGQGISKDGNYITAVFEDGNAVVWAVEGLAPRSASRVHTQSIKSLAWSPDGSMIVTAGQDGTAMISDGESGYRMYPLNPGAPSVYNAFFTKDGSEIITGDEARQIKVWKPSTGAELRTIAILPEGYWPFQTLPSGDEKELIVSTWGGVRVYDKQTGEQKRQFDAPGLNLFALGVSPDGKYVAAGAPDGRVFVWDYASGALVAELREHRSAINAINFSPDSKRMVTASSDRSTRMWDVGSFSVRMLLNSEDLVLWAAFSPDGQQVITTGFDASVRLWDAETGAELANFVGPGRPFRGAVFSPDMTRIAAAGDDQKLYLWNAPTKTMANTQTGAPILASALNADNGKLLREMISWAPLTVSKPLSPSDREVNFLAPDPQVRVFAANVTSCDLLAAYASDPQRVAPGVREGWIIGPEAVAACRAALEATPGEPRLRLQLGRALVADSGRLKNEGKTQEASDRRAEAVTEVQAAADAGYAGAIYYRGFMTVDQDAPSADELRVAYETVRKAWDMGVPDAGDMVAKSLLDGVKSSDGQEIVKQDVPAAIDVYKKAAEKGSWFASVNLAFIYEYGRAGVDPNPDASKVEANAGEALYYFALAARQVEIEGFVESTEAQRASYLFAKRATLARAMVREGKGTELAALAERVAGWKPSDLVTAPAAEAQPAAE